MRTCYVVQIATGGGAEIAWIGFGFLHVSILGN